MKVSTCCGANDRETYEDGPSYEDVGFCSECKDHSDYIDVCDECSEEKCVCEPSGPSIAPHGAAVTAMAARAAAGALLAFLIVVATFFVLVDRPQGFGTGPDDGVEVAR